jgi:hypothetical protein
MTAHRPADPPLQPRLKSTLNIRASVRDTAIAQNQIAKRVVDYLHSQILQNHDRLQIYRHEDIGTALGIDPRKVRLGLAHAGGDCITVEVTPQCRIAIKKVGKR